MYSSNTARIRIAEECRFYIKEGVGREERNRQVGEKEEAVKEATGETQDREGSAREEVRG